MDKIITAFLLATVAVYFNAKADNFIPKNDPNCKATSCVDACTVWGFQVANRASDECNFLYDCTACLENAKKQTRHTRRVIVRSKY